MKCGTYMTQLVIYIEKCVKMTHFWKNVCQIGRNDRGRGGYRKTHVQLYFSCNTSNFFVK
jgi:hypothetical protein